MTTRAAAGFLGLLFWTAVLFPAPLSARESFSMLYLSRADDPDYVTQRRYTGLSLRERKSPIEGARLAMRDSRIKGRALGLTFELEELSLQEGQSATALLGAETNRVVLLDLPYEETRAVIEALGEREDLILFNIRHADNALRQELCAPALLHSLPSLAMQADALAQFLAAQDWRDVLVLESEEPDSLAWSEAFKASAKKFGLTIVAETSFELTNDPRRRDRSNVALMTGGSGYDVVFLADEFGEFGRYVPYATYAPRPVVGSEGLRPLAWHWTWERHGAPQLNQRFRKQAKRNMEGTDWAAWAAIRAVVEAIARSKSTELADLRAFMTSEDFTLDVYKGAPGAFRPWSGQLRQPILLATHNAIIERAPLEEFLHQDNNLDTLGFDRRESRCRLAERD